MIFKNENHSLVEKSWNQKKGQGLKKNKLASLEESN